MLSGVAVVVPAHDEQELLSDCLAGIARAAAAVPVPVDVLVVLDACTDDTGTVAAAAAVRTVAVTARNVGSARAAGIAALLDTRRDLAGTWIANTDADSVVPAHWLARQLAYAAAGADVVAGTVEVADWSAWPTRTAAAYRGRYAPGWATPDAHGHVHGTNLGMRAVTYRAVGGFPALASGEDAALVTAALRAGRRVVWAPDLPVRTSARPAGRAPGGFSGYLHELTGTAAQPQARAVAGSRPDRGFPRVGP